MRILDVDSDRSLSRVILYLTADEVGEMRSALDAIRLDHGGHEHVASIDYKKEITVCVYDPSTVDGFSERSKRLIVEDV